jgi:hypothetical protein
MGISLDRESERHGQSSKMKIHYADENVNPEKAGNRRSQ